MADTIEVLKTIGIAALLSLAGWAFAVITEWIY